VEHPTSLSSPGTWRAAAILAAGVAALELVVIVVVVLAAFAKPFSGDADIVAAVTPGKKAAKVEASKPADPAKKPTPAPAVAKLARNETSVIILNGNGIQGAADEAAGVVQSLRYLIAGTGNAPRTDFARSLVMYRPGYKGEAMRLAEDVRVRRVVPLDGMRAAELQGAHVALILGRS
jgi:hypothetical protein